MEGFPKSVLCRVWRRRRSIKTGRWTDWIQCTDNGPWNEMTALTLLMEAVRCEHLVLPIGETPMHVKKDKKDLP